MDLNRPFRCYRITRTFLMLLLLTGSAMAQQSTSAVSLESLIETALQNNPELQAQQRTIEASRTAVPQAGSLPDPKLNLNLMNMPANTFKFDQEPMTGKQVGVMQTIPFPGKLGLKSDIARKSSEDAEAHYEELKNRIVRDIKLNYFELFYIDEAIRTTENNEQLISELVEVAQTKYQVGKGLQQDVLKAQVERSKMMDRLINLKQKRRTIVSAINTLLNRPVDTPIEAVKEPLYEPIVLSLDSLLAYAAKYRPLLKQWQARSKQSALKNALARKQYWPDFSLSVAYTQRDVLQSGAGGVDFLSAGVSVKLPLYFWRKQDKQVEESVNRRRATESGAKDARNRVLNRLDDVYGDLQKEMERIELYRTGIIPQASQSLEAATTGYRTDKVDFLTLIDNTLTLFDLELAQKRIVSEYHKNIARLEYIVGLSQEEMQ